MVKTVVQKRTLRCLDRPCDLAMCSKYVVVLRRASLQRSSNLMVENLALCPARWLPLQCAQCYNAKPHSYSMVPTGALPEVPFAKHLIRLQQYHIGIRLERRIKGTFHNSGRFSKHIFAQYHPPRPSEVQQPESIYGSVISKPVPRLFRVHFQFQGAGVYS